MGFFQTVYDTIKNWKAPAWVKIFLQEIQDIIVSVALQVGRDYLDNLRNKIIEVSMQDISNENKFKIVFDYGKYLMVNIKDSYLNLLIEILVNKLKGEKSI